MAGNRLIQHGKGEFAFAAMPLERAKPANLVCGNQLGDSLAAELSIEGT